MAQAAVRSRETRCAIAGLGYPGGRRRDHPLVGRGGGHGIHGVGGGRRPVRAAERQERLTRSVLRAAVGGPGGGLVGRWPRVAGDLADAHAVPDHAVAVAFPSRGLSRPAGVLPRRVRLVCIRVAGARKPRSRITARGQALAARIRRRDGAWRRPVRGTLVRTGRPVRGVQRGRVTPVAAAAQPRNAPGRGRQPVRPPAVAARGTGHRHGARGAAGLDGVRQFLGDTGVARLRRRPGARFTGDRDPGADVRAGGVRGGRRRHVFVGGVRDGWSESTAAASAARADGPFTDPDRRRLHLRPLPVVPGGTRAGDDGPTG